MNTPFCVFLWTIPATKYPLKQTNLSFYISLAKSVFAVYKEKSERFNRILHIRSKLQSVIKYFSKNKEEKLEKTKNTWFILLLKFWPLPPKNDFWLGDCTLAFVSSQDWDCPAL